MRNLAWACSALLLTGCAFVSMTPSGARVRVLAELQRQPRTVSELGASLEMTQTTLSNHLRVLRILGLVTTQRDGRFVRYSLHDAHVAELLSATLSHAAHVSMAGGIAASS